MSRPLIGIVNPNTTASMTGTVVEAATAVAGPLTDLVGLTPTVGPATVVVIRRTPAGSGCSASSSPSRTAIASASGWSCQVT